MTNGHSGVSRRDLLQTGSALIALGAAGSAAAPAHAQTAGGQKPHILYILADDLGWKDVGFNGSDIKTPHIDKLAAAGARFDQFYAEPMCTPTRAALMTGRYPMRYGLQTGVIPAGGKYGLATDEWILPQMLKDAGYATAMVGKWHLGHSDPKYWPRQRGFDHFYGALVGEIDHFKHQSHGTDDWYRGNKVVKEPGYDTTLFGQEAARVIERHDVQKPLFLYLAFTAPHAPYQAPKEYLDRYPGIADPNRRAYAGMVSAMDDEVGRVMQALEKRAMRNNTLIVFHSDNGGTRNATFTGDSVVKGELPCDNGPYRDGKGTLYEGGTRVCGLINWPGRIKPGVVDGMMHVVDMYPTLATLAEATPARSKPLDGMDLWPALSSGATTPRQEIVYNIEPFRAAVRQGDWKLKVTALLPGQTELFNLNLDASEKANKATENPAKVTELRGRIEELAKQAVPPLLMADMVRLTFGAAPSTPELITELSD